jgi:predicted HicB family RNase H-like nuclease
MKKVNISLQDETHTQAKIIAVLKDVTLNDYMQKAIEECIERDRKILDKINVKK